SSLAFASLESKQRRGSNDQEDLAYILGHWRTSRSVHTLGGELPLVLDCKILCQVIPFRVILECGYSACMSLDPSESLALLFLLAVLLSHKYIHLVYLSSEVRADLEYYYTYHQRCRIVVLSFSQILRFSDSRRSLRFSFSR